MKKQIIFLFLLVLSPIVPAQEEQLPEQCIETLTLQAKKAGLPQSLINDVIPKLKRISKVVQYDRSQPEFTETFASYLNKRVTDTRIKKGKQLLKKHKVFLESLFRQYGVPGRYLIAFWGLETNFGSYLGKMSTLNSLATLACDERRSEFFTDELLLALKLIERESLQPDKMKGSWAGAMGHTQFMPSTYYQYAVDGDGDGIINLWLSEKDALASGAHYLQQLGWKSGERWGREVKLPKGFPYKKTGMKKAIALKDWNVMGVTSVNGNVLADLDMKSAILVPSGHSGPAFLVYHNFDIIMHWNRSKSYALAVGLLADRIAGLGPLSQTGKNQQALSHKTVLALQENLNKAGFNTGQPDGILGSKTQQAIQDYQVSAGLIADGYPGSATISKLLNQ
ncbi:MAG: lytic murein transglycosylase [Gammaproteobacteria bacterium]|nr:lytic murein transglycosylase [Gammaproteobacteria bacterium]